MAEIMKLFYLKKEKKFMYLFGTTVCDRHSDLCWNMTGSEILYAQVEAIFSDPISYFQQPKPPQNKIKF